MSELIYALKARKETYDTDRLNNYYNIKILIEKHITPFSLKNGTPNFRIFYLYNHLLV